MVSASLVWFGFLIHLEWRHRDRGRAYWSPAVWMCAWAVGLALNPSIGLAVAVLLSIAYSYKKRFRFVGRVSFLYNGLLKVALVAGMPGATPRDLLLVGSVMAVRNLAGDFRDVRKDRADGATTLPILLGLRDDVRWLYPTCLGATSLLWWSLGSLPISALLVAWLVELLTYRLTPR